MDNIRAFVGHSFTEDDAAVVRSFLSYFTEVSNIYPSFSWEHAEVAEPSQLKDKIFALLRDKNTFVGICTKKERVVSTTRLKPTWWSTNRLSIKTSEIEWKTSDWIIQEIGLAAGRGMSIILLVETGVRKPGGIQGDIEYITFDRLYPERTHEKFLQMLRALSPTAPIKQLSPSVKTPEAKQIDESDATTDGSDTNKGEETFGEDWKRADYELALFRAIARDDDRRSGLITAAYLKSSDAAIPSKAASWIAYLESARILLGKGGSLPKLQQVFDQNQNNPEVLFYLGTAYGRFSDQDKAAKLFAQASSLADGPEEKAKYLYHSINAFRKAGALAEADKQINNLRSLSQTTAEAEFRLLEALADLAKDTENKELEVATLERKIQINPNDSDTRFSLAFAHDELGNEDIALNQYLILATTGQGEAAWNNLGVAYDSFNMPIKSVQAYRKSEEQGGSLATSNLAQKLIGAGFLDEAKALCDKALTMNDYHKNNALLAARLKDLPSEEDEALRKLRKRMKPKIDFYREAGEAVSASQPRLGRIWKGPDCNLSLEMHENVVHLTGSFKQQQNLLSLAIMGSSASPVPKTHHIDIEGKFTGRLIQGTLKRRIADAPPPTLLSMSDEATKILMIVSKDFRTIRIMENPTSETPVFFNLNLQEVEE